MIRELDLNALSSAGNHLITIYGTWDSSTGGIKCIYLLCLCRAYIQKKNKSINRNNFMLID